MNEEEIKDVPNVEVDASAQGKDEASSRSVEPEKPETVKSKPKKKKKVKYVDDGHTVYSMEGLDEIRGIRRRGDGIKLSREERRAAIRAAFARYLPVLLIVIGSFTLAALLLYFWLI